MILDRRFAAPSNENELFDTRGGGLFHGILDKRFIDDGQHFFRHGLGRGQEPRTEPANGENGLTNWRCHVIADQQVQ